MNPMKATLVAAVLLCVDPAYGSEHVIYPSAGQDRDQQASDEAQCLVWAKDETGVDPVTAAPGKVAAPDRARGGALRGAAVGAVVGEIVDDEAGEGAAAGAAAGVLRQRRRSRRELAEAASEQAELDAAHEADMALFDRHYVACMKGRDYVVD